MKLIPIVDQPEYRAALAAVRANSLFNIVALRVDELERLLVADRQRLEARQTNYENIRHSHSLLDSDLTEALEYNERLVCALKDCISTYMGGDKLVTAERIEAWQAALNSK